MSAWLVVGGAATAVSLAVVAVCKLLFAVVALHGVPPRNRSEIVRAIGGCLESMDAGPATLVGTAPGCTPRPPSDRSDRRGSREVVEPGPGRTLTGHGPRHAKSDPDVACNPKSASKAAVGLRHGFGRYRAVRYVVWEDRLDGRGWEAWCSVAGVISGRGLDVWSLPRWRL